MICLLTLFQKCWIKVKPVLLNRFDVQLSKSYGYYLASLILFAQLQRTVVNTFHLYYLLSNEAMPPLIKHSECKPVAVITGSASGIGLATKKLLIKQGFDVIGVDLNAADICADLSKKQERQSVIDKILDQYPSGIHALVCSAGLGPHTEDLGLVAKVNYFGTIELVQGLLPCLQNHQGSAVVLSSNSASLPGLDEGYIEKLLSGQEQEAADYITKLDGHNAYAGSKRALITWVKQQAPAAIKNGVNINAVAPGMTQTNLTDGVMADATFGDAMRQFAELIPAGFVATPEMIADVIAFLVSKSASYVSGATLFVDGGQDAALRPEGI